MTAMPRPPLACLCSQAQQTAGVATQYGAFRLWIEPQGFHLGDGVGKTRGQWVITANDQPFGAVRVDQITQHVLKAMMSKVNWLT